MKKNVISTSFLLASFMLIGKLFSFFRQIVIAWTFGSNKNTDIYFLSESFTGVFTTIFSAFVSFAVLIEYINAKNNSEKEASHMANNTFSIMLIFTLIMVCLVDLFAVPISRFFIGNPTVSDISTMSFYIRLSSPVIVIAPLTYVLCSVLEGNEIFWPSKLQSLILSTIVCIWILLFHDYFGVLSIVIGNLVGYAVFFVFIFLRLPKPKVCISKPRIDKYVKNIFFKCPSIIISIAVIDVNHLIDKMIASHIEEGGVSALYYGQILSTDIVSAVLITSISSILISKLTQSVIDNDKEKQIYIVNNAITIFMLITFFIIICYLFNGKNLILFIFNHGKFDMNAVSLTLDVIWGYLGALLLIPIREVIIRTYYANNDVKTPMTTSVICCAINLILSIVLSKIIGVLGIALATSISTLIQTIILLLRLRNKYTVSKLFNKNELFRFLISAILSFISVFCVFIVFDNLYIRLFVGTIFLFIIYFVVLYLIKSSTVHDLVHSLMIKIKKQKGKI